MPLVVQKLLTISVRVNEICNIITNYLGSAFIKNPVTQGDVQSAIDGFLQKFGFPLVIGYIGGTHVPIQQSNENACDYFSYEMKYTINCQAICNHNGKFISVGIRWSDIVHAARMFANSKVQKSYCEKKFDLFSNQIKSNRMRFWEIKGKMENFTKAIKY